MSVVMEELLSLLDLENLEVNLFRGRSHDYFGHNVFGGQVLGQALMAAGRTVENNLLAHSSTQLNVCVMAVASPHAR